MTDKLYCAGGCGVRRVAFKVLVGSHNYNLSTPESDRDYKYFVFPSFEDLYHNRYYHESHISDDQDYEIHDIRRLGELFIKSNPHYLETLYSQSYEWFDNEIKEFLIGNRHRLAIMNRPRLWSSIFGMGCEKESKILKGTSGTKHLVEAHGYDTKQAMHSYRAFELISLLVVKEWDFGNAIWLEEHNRNFYLSIKNGSFPLEKFKELLAAVKQSALNWEPHYKSFEIDVAIQDELNEFIKNKVKKELLND